MSVTDESTPVSDAPPRAHIESGLSRGAAGGLEVFSQGLAAAGPTVAIAAVPGLLFLIAGNGAVVAAFMAVIVVLLIAYLISLQARLTVSVGSLGTYSGNGLGDWAAFASSWGLLLGYLAFAGGGMLDAAIYLTQFFAKIGVDLDTHLWKVVLLVLVAIPSVLLPYRGIRMSARVGLALEFLSLLLIGIIIVATWISTGLTLNGDLLSASGAKTSAIMVAGVLAVGAYAGFESSASLGFEAREPHRTIPRVIMRTVLFLGVLYVIATYTLVQGFGGELGPDSAPLVVVAENTGVGWTTYVITLAVAVAFIAFVVAVLNAGARSVFTLASTGSLPRVLARPHPTYRSPYLSILLLSAVALASGIVGTVASSGRLLFDTYLNTIGTWGFLTAYILISIATPIYLARVKALKPACVVAAVLATGALGYIIYKNLVPAPEYPYNILPYIYFGLLGVGLVRFAHLRFTNPAQARELTKLQELSDAELERREALELARD